MYVWKLASGLGLGFEGWYFRGGGNSFGDGEQWHMNMGDDADILGDGRMRRQWLTKELGGSDCGIVDLRVLVISLAFIDANQGGFWTMF